MKSWMLFLWVTSYQSLSLVPPCWNNWHLTSLMLNFLIRFIKIILFCVSYSMKKNQYLMADNYEISFFINLKKYKSLLKCPKLWQLIRKIATSRDILRKRCSENTQQIYRRTPMPKCDFNKVASWKATLLKSHFGMGVLLKIWCIFWEHLFLRTPLDGCICTSSKESFLLSRYAAFTLSSYFE